MWFSAWGGVAVQCLVFALHVAVIVRAITRRNRAPAARTAWVAVILLLPVLGPMAYVLLGETSIGRARQRALRAAEAAIQCPRFPAVELDTPAAELFALVGRINGHAACSGNRIQLIGADPATPAEPTRDCDAALQGLIADIERARDTVHLSFYIWLDDGNGGRMADAVRAAAQRGVACRVMVDALGSHAFVRSPRWKQLREAGVHLVAALEDVPRIGHLAIGRVDLRNHRKLAIIDNQIAWCGSQNCADPAFRIEPHFAPWIDLLLRCEGPVVRQAQRLFLETWMAETAEALAQLPAQEPLPPTNAHGATALMFGTSALTHGNAMSDAFVAAIYAARRELLITTPYFVPDEALLRALCSAPRRGVATTLILPARNNSRLVDLACRGTWPALLASGVDVQLYHPGLLHTKSITIDGALAVVGSANMDRRSLELNFENNLLIADAATVAAIRERQRGYLTQCSALTQADNARVSFGKRLLEETVGMLAPLL